MLKFRHEVLNEKQRKILPSLSFLKENNFYLAGGTALAFYLGHRTSLDFDFYTQAHFDSTLLYQKIDNIFGTKAILTLKEEDALNYLGGRGIATKLFTELTNPSIDPLSPKNNLVFATTPLTDTSAPASGRGHVVFKSPLTNTIGSSNSGGEWAVYLKRTGIDALVIKGKAHEPVCIFINDSDDINEKIKILPAKHLWGKNTHETTENILNYLSCHSCLGRNSGENSQYSRSNEPIVNEINKLEPKQIDKDNSRVLCIGQAGENLVRYASIMNEKNRAYGRGGAGAVMGSKNLKAIVVSGKKRITIANKERFQQVINQINYRLKAVPATKRILKSLGTAGLVNLINCINMLPHNNFKDTQHSDEDLWKMCGETISETILRKVGGCFHCPIQCQRHTQIGEKVGEGPEYETVVLLGPVLGIYDLKSITLANYLCNEFGLDTISCGGSIASAMELYEKGIITNNDTEGLNLRFGNYEILEEIVKEIVFREGIGKHISEGSLRLCKNYEKPEYSMSIKGMELPAYDPRASFIQALGYATSPTGACHLRGGYAVSLAFFGGAKEIPRFSIRQAPLSIRNVQDVGIIQDSIGICRFTGFAVSIDVWSKAITSALGREITKNHFEKVAERIATLEREFNINAGLTQDDDTLPARFQKEYIIVSNEKKIVSPDALKLMKEGYYYLRGWKT